MDKQYFEYIEHLEGFMDRNARHIKCLQKSPNIEMYLEHFREKAIKNGEFLNMIGMANLYDSKLLDRFGDKIVYFSHFIADQGARRFCGIIQFEENLHALVSYGSLGEDGFLTNIDFYTTEPEKVVEFIRNNKDIEFVKGYNKNMGFRSDTPPPQPRGLNR